MYFTAFVSPCVFMFFTLVVITAESLQIDPLNSFLSTICYDCQFCLNRMDSSSGLLSSSDLGDSHALDLEYHRLVGELCVRDQYQGQVSPRRFGCGASDHLTQGVW